VEIYQQFQGCLSAEDPCQQLSGSPPPKQGDVKVKVDIVAVFRCLGRHAWCLAIEDKVQAGLSAKDQLINNYLVVRKACEEGQKPCGVRPDRVKGVYFKSGYDFDWPVPKDIYVKVNFASLQGFVRLARELNYGGSEILRDWICWCGSQLDEIRRRVCDVECELRRLMNKTDVATYKSGWRHQDFQYAALKYLFRLDELPILDACETEIWFERDGDRVYILYSHGVGGSPFAQYWPHPSEKETDARQFFRLDYRADGWGLRLKDYIEKGQRERCGCQEKHARAEAHRLNEILRARGTAHGLVAEPGWGPKEVPLLSIDMTDSKHLEALRDALCEFTTGAPPCPEHEPGCPRSEPPHTDGPVTNDAEPDLPQ
jgi:hypothetical protein